MKAYINPLNVSKRLIQSYSFCSWTIQIN